MTALEQWIERQYRHSAEAMLRSVSAVQLVKERPGFGQSIRARKGSVIASPVLGSYDPDPDYFFHWFRDSAVVIDAPIADGAVAPVSYQSATLTVRSQASRDDILYYVGDAVPPACLSPGLFVTSSGQCIACPTVCLSACLGTKL